MDDHISWTKIYKLTAKEQKFSKPNYFVLISSKQQTKYLTNISFVFWSFLEEVRSKWTDFEIFWPFARKEQYFNKALSSLAPVFLWLVEGCHMTESQSILQVEGEQKKVP